MIIAYIMGGIGNQLFQYATGRRLAHKLNTQLKLDISHYKQDNLRSYILNLFNIQENLATPQEIEQARRFSFENSLGQENKNADFMPEVLDYPDNVFLHGYWQNEEYFADISDILRREFTLKNSLSATAQSWKEKILATECPVSLHFRHGDFLYSPINVTMTNYFAVPPLDYYYRCIEILKHDYKNLTLFIFSDNLNWVKENFRADMPVEFIEGENLQDAEELHLMSLCKHNIINKSTFGWWGAWLNQNPGKKVFMPTSANVNPQIKTPNNLIDSDNWIKISFDIGQQPAVTMRPYFSILLVVNNDAATLVKSLESILGQDYKYFELIIIDNASTDGSGKICREVVKTHDNVTLIKLHGKVQNGAAWNIALDVAQGYYVLFLKGNEKLFSHALTSLYLTNEHILADIVNAIAWAREPKNEESSVLDGKFILERESLFKGELRSVFREKLDKLSLLRILSSNAIATPIGTRLFKRKFLKQNKIRFKEKIGKDSELLFVAEAMFHTKEIIFVPNIFYIAPKS